MPPPIPTAAPVFANPAQWGIASAVPVDAAGNSLIPELALPGGGYRMPTHNESVLIDGQFPISMASSNVDEIWWNWQQRRLFVKFLNGSLYCYNGVGLQTAVDMIETASPGRFCWNVLRVGWPTKGTGPGTYQQLTPATRRGKPRPRVVRLIP